MVEEAYDFQRKRIKNKSGKKLKDLKLKDKKIRDLSVRRPGYDMVFRVIAFWYKNKKRIGYLVTNLPRETVVASDIVELHRLRWQIEIAI